MRVFDFDGTIYRGESLFDLYLFSLRYEPKVLRYIAPVLNCGIRYKIGKVELNQIERKLDTIIGRYLTDMASSRRLEKLQHRYDGDFNAPYWEAEPQPVDRPANIIATDIAPDGVPPVQASADGIDTLAHLFWERRFRRIKAWYEPRPDDVIVTASFDLTVGEACRRLGVNHLIASTIDPETLAISYLNLGMNKVRRFHEIYGDVTIDEFYTDSRHDQPMVDIARTAYLVKGNTLIRIK